MDGFVRWIRGFIQELRRRRVIRVAVVYAGTGFAILELADILTPALRLPSWTVRFIAVLLILGFPLAVGLAWVYNVTEEGLVRIGTEKKKGGKLGPGGKPFTSDAVIIGLLVLIAGLLLYPRITGPAGPSPSEEAQGGLAVPEDTATARLGPKSVAVLPFTYLAAEDSSDYFSVGMTDELITRLTQVEDLPVISRTSVMQYQETEKTIPEIARELDVARVVEGSVQKAGGKVRIQAQLVDARTGEHLWAGGFTRPFRDVLDLQVDLAREIAGHLKAKLLPHEEKKLSRGREVDSTAYALYLQGRRLRFQETSESLREAVRLLRRSVSIDSTFAPAWATLSTAAWFGSPPEEIDGDSLARAAARRALELDSTSAEAHVAMGLVREVLDLNFPAAGPHLERAVELNPGLADANREYGLYFWRMRRFEVADRYLRKAARLDPASPLVFRDLGWNNLSWGHYDRARRYLEKALTLAPNLPGARFQLWMAYIAQDSLEVARRKFSQAIESDPTLSVRPFGSLGLVDSALPSGWKVVKLWAYGLAGRRDSARQVARRLQGEADNFYQKAVAYAHLGQPKKAMGFLKQSLSLVGSHLKIDPGLKPLWKEPRFQRLLREMGLDEATVQETMEKLSPKPPDGPTGRSRKVPGERSRRSPPALGFPPPGG